MGWLVDPRTSPGCQWVAASEGVPSGMREAQEAVARSVHAMGRSRGYGETQLSVVTVVAAMRQAVAVGRGSRPPRLGLQLLRRFSPARSVSGESVAALAQKLRQLRDRETHGRLLTEIAQHIAPYARLDRFTSSELIRQCASHGLTREMRQILTASQARRVGTDSVLYTSLVAGYVRAGALESAWQCLEDMRKDRIAPTVHTFGALASGLGRLGRVSDAEATYRAMEAAGVRADTRMLTIMMDVYGRAGELESMHHYYELLRRRANPDLSGATLIRLKAYAAVADEAAVRDIARQLERGELVKAPSQPLYSAAVSALADVGRIPDALQFLSHFADPTSGREPPDDIAWSNLLRHCLVQNHLELGASHVLPRFSDSPPPSIRSTVLDFVRACRRFKIPLPPSYA